MSRPVIRQWRPIELPPQPLRRCSADNFAVCQAGCYCAVLQQFRGHRVMDILYYP
jgi:hypothetical protein